MSADTLTASIADAAERGARRALADHTPRLVLRRLEAAEMLGVSTTMVDAMCADGRLSTIAAGRITLASVLAAAGWPVVPASVGAPLTTIGVAS